MTGKQLPTCSEFCAMRDAFQRERQAKALVALKDQWEALKRQIQPLERKLKNASKHDKPLLENELMPLWWQKQDIWAQWSAITSGVGMPEWGIK